MTLGLIICFVTFGVYMMVSAEPSPKPSSASHSHSNHNHKQNPTLTLRASFYWRWVAFGGVRAPLPTNHPPTLIDIASSRPHSPQYAPFIDNGDDFLSQICQMQIFFSLLSTIILQVNPNSPLMAVLLPILITFPPISGFIFESGVLDELKKVASFLDNGWPIPFSGGKRVGVGCRSKTTECLERLLGVKKAPEEEAEEADEPKPTPALGELINSPAWAPAAEVHSTQAAVDVPEHLKALFMHFDRDNSGCFVYRELRNALRALGYDASHPFAASLIKQYDDIPDGKMQLTEFATLVAQLEQGFIRSALTPMKVAPPEPSALTPMKVAPAEPSALTPMKVAPAEP